MKQILAIATLTLKAAIRFRVVVVTAIILFTAVVLLPMLVKHDDTAKGFIQILLTYTLSIITALLGVVTLWLACNSLARDMEECQMQLVAVKPVPRWKIWLGKWLGIMVLNSVMLVGAGVTVFAMLVWKSSELPEVEQTRLEQEVMVARAAVVEPVPDLAPVIERAFAEARQNVDVAPEDLPLLRQQVVEAVKRNYELVNPDHLRRWRMDFSGILEEVRDKPLYGRFKFITPDYFEGNLDMVPFDLVWKVGKPDDPNRKTRIMSLPPGSYTEFLIPPGLIDAETGELIVDMENRSGAQMYVPLDEPFEVLYRENSFAVNFGRAMVILFCWLCLLSAIGLTASSCLSFPVATFVAFTILFISLSTGSFQEALSENSFLGRDYSGDYGSKSENLDRVMLPFFRFALGTINLVKDFSPVDSLSSGRSITWSDTGRAVFQVVIFTGGIIAAIGVVIFNRRELGSIQQGS